MTPSQEERFAAALAGIADNPAAVAELTIFATALKRGDRALVHGLQELARMRRSDLEPVDLSDDELAVLPRLRAVCDEQERVAWGRALAGACRGGDRRRVDRLLDLAQRRCAA